MDNIGIYVKALLTSLLTAISLRIGQLGGLLWLFIAAVTLDYITGVIAAAYNKELSSGVGLRGVVKKVALCFVIAVAIISDEVVSQAGQSFGIIASTGGALVTIVTIWIILNELISILENVSEIGVDLPPFLLSVISMLKKSAEALGEKTTPENGDKGSAPKNGSEQ